MLKRSLKTCAVLAAIAPLTGAFSFASQHHRPASSSLFSTETTATSEPRGISETKESSASRFSGAGPIQVDMNDYNLPVDDIAEQWTAVLLPSTPMQEEGVYLGAKNSRELFVDSIKVEVPRKVGAGLGLELLELAGGREDGLGITVVSGLVEGGSADGSPVMVGDSIVQLRVVDKDMNEVASIATECLGYDAMVDAIVSLPPAESDDEKIVLTLKRLRRKPKVKVTFQYPPEMKEDDISLELFSGENLRRSMLVKGIKLNDPLARRFDSGGSGDCGAEGTCATCAVSVVRGEELLSPPGQQEAQIFKPNPRWRMTCKAIVGYGMQEGELVVRLSPRQWN